MSSDEQIKASVEAIWREIVRSGQDREVMLKVLRKANKKLGGNK